MMKNRDNCVILLVSPPEEAKIGGELKTAFGPERSVHVNGDLLTQAYKTIKNFNNAIPILSYEKTLHHPDLTWLDPEDPGFLEFKDKPLEDRMRDVFRLSFFTGAKKAVIIDHLSPEVTEDWISQALEAVNDKTVALGANQDGSFYLLGMTQAHMKLLDSPGFTTGKSAEVLTERIKKAKLSVFSSPETYCVTSEESLRRWLESREAAQHIFTEPATAAPKNSESHPETPHKRPSRRHARVNEEHQTKPPQESV
jgi:glycosyltransferase A (GT-A) superfamily protein (DUF2064 family)